MRLLNIFMISFLMILISYGLGQDTVPDSTADSSYSVLDSAVTAVVEHSPSINIPVILIKLFWTIVTVIISVLLWRYLLQPVIKMLF